MLDCCNPIIFSLSFLEIATNFQAAIDNLQAAAYSQVQQDCEHGIVQQGYKTGDVLAGVLLDNFD